MGFFRAPVMSVDAVFPYKGNPAPPARVARELGVQYQVEGSVLRSADRIRVNARLVDHKGRVHWSGRFDEPASDLFALQDRITRDVAGALAIHVTRIEEARACRSPEELEPTTTCGARVAAAAADALGGRARELLSAPSKSTTTRPRMHAPDTYSVLCDGL